jgi:hypothetical protein
MTWFLQKLVFTYSMLCIKNPLCKVHSTKYQITYCLQNSKFYEGKYSGKATIKILHYKILMRTVLKPYIREDYTWNLVSKQNGA